MGFLRNMFGGDLTRDDPRRYLVEAMLGAMAADGDIQDEEMQVLYEHVETHALFDGLSQDQTQRLIDMASDALAEAGGPRARVAAIAKGLPGRNHRRAAYAMASAVCVADNELPEGEIVYLEDLQTALGIDDDEAREIFEAARAHSGLLTLEEKAARTVDLLPLLVDGVALMAAADGVVHEDEVAGIRAVLRNIPDLSVLTPKELDEAIEAAFERVADKPIEQELTRIAGAMPSLSDRYWTVVYIMIVAIADGQEAWREVEALDIAKRAFELDDEQMDQAMATAALFPQVELGGPAPV